jgi:hypothetical protein
VTRLRLGPVVAVAVAVAAGVVVGLARHDGGSAPDAVPAPVAVSSDAPRLSSLDELVAVTDLVVRATVVDAARGRVFGDPDSEATIESRVLTLRIDGLLHGTDPHQREVLVEEEGWDADGAPLVVDGADPSTIGDDGVWFLSGVGSGEEHRYVVVSAEGRYLVEGGGLRGARGNDPLIARLVALGPAGLAAGITALP